MRATLTGLFLIAVTAGCGGDSEPVPVKTETVYLPQKISIRSLPVEQIEKGLAHERKLLEAQIDPEKKKLADEYIKTADEVIRSMKLQEKTINSLRDDLASGNVKDAVKHVTKDLIHQLEEIKQKAEAAKALQEQVLPRAEPKTQGRIKLGSAYFFVSLADETTGGDIDTASEGEGIDWEAILRLLKALIDLIVSLFKAFGGGDDDGDNSNQATQPDSVETANGTATEIPVYDGERPLKPGEQVSIGSDKDGKHIVELEESSDSKSVVVRVVVNSDFKRVVSVSLQKGTDIRVKKVTADKDGYPVHMEIQFGDKDQKWTWSADGGEAQLTAGNLEV